MQTIRQTIISDADVRLTIDDAMDLPAEIEQEQRIYNKMSAELPAFSIPVGDAEQESKEARKIILIVVEHETINNGTEEKPKLKPVFSNQAARDLETDTRCKNDLAYQSALIQLRKAQAGLFAKKTELEDQAAKIKRLGQSLSIRQSIIIAVAGLAQEEVHSAQLKAIAKVKAVIAEISGDNHEDK